MESNCGLEGLVFIVELLEDSAIHFFCLCWPLPARCPAVRFEGPHVMILPKGACDHVSIDSCFGSCADGLGGDLR